jgi:hypothetical protein
MRTDTGGVGETGKRNTDGEAAGGGRRSDDELAAGDGRFDDLVLGYPSVQVFISAAAR